MSHRHRSHRDRRRSGRQSRAATAVLALGAFATFGTLAGACSNKGANQSPAPTNAGTTTTSASIDSTTHTSVGATSAPAPTSTPAPTVSPTVTLAPKNLRLGLVAVATIESPTALAVRTGDPTLFVTSQLGIVYAVRAGQVPVAVLDISTETQAGGEQGLLGLAFSPDGKVGYVDFTLPDGSAQISAFAVTADGTFDRASRRALLNIPHPGQANHNGGSLVVDAAGLLYIGMGDGGGAGDPDRHGQDRTVLLGKILRIDPNPAGKQGYDIPADNPYYAQNSKRNEIWSYGLRNPWRFSFDRLNGDLWIGDVGQNDIEEIDHVSAADGAGKDVNFGWSAYEGSKRYNNDQQADNVVMPLYQYSHKGKSASVIGGYVYRGRAIPAMYGAYLFGDEVLGTLSALRINKSGKAVVARVGSVETLSSFGQDNDGELYALSFSRNTVYKIVAA